MKQRLICVLPILAALLMPSGIVKAEVFLPGTQPLEGGVEFGKVSQCVLCHGETANGNADPYRSWQGGMMAQAARDPVFRATLTIANQDVKGVGEYCIRCHSPRGWLEGRSKSPDGSDLTSEDMHGVSCDFCHHMVDPLKEEARKLVKHVPPGYGNGMVVVDPLNVSRGPYGDGTGAMPHRVQKSELHGSSELCATCHNVSNPLQAEDVRTQPPHAYGVIERTYSEWKLSDFSKLGKDGTCQSCHYPRVPEGGKPARYSERHRDYFVMHGPVGGSTWVQTATLKLWDTDALTPFALKNGVERARKMLRTAAELDLTFPDAKTARLRITNLTGHKLPTGYPEGRRMWVNAVYLDSAGKVLKETGRYGITKDRLQDKEVEAPTLLDPETTRVYECLPGISEEQAKKFNQKPGKSFHFVLNDVITKDNRIPPKGFKNETFAAQQCQPVGATYEDGQNWDELSLPLPEGTATVQVRLMYQSVSWEYLKFLVEENRTDDWGKRLYKAWSETGQCAPETIAELSRAVAQ